MADITALHAERRTVLAEADRVLAASERRQDMTAEEKQQFDRLHERAKTLQSQIDAETARRSHTAMPEETFTTDAGLRVGTLRGENVFVHPDSDHGRRAKPGYAARFMHAVFGTGIGAVGLGTDVTDGGYNLAPPQFVVGLLKGLEDGSWFRALANVRPPSDAESVVQATRTAKMSSIYWAQQLPDYDRTGRPLLGGSKLVPHYLSGELEVARGVLGGPGSEDVVRGELYAAANAVEEAAFVAGDGQNKPVGLFHPAEPGQGIDASRDMERAIGDADTWIDARLSLRSVYLRSPSLRWVMHPSAYKVAAKIETTGGSKVVTRASRAGDRDHIDGVPIEFTDDAPQGSGEGGAFEAGDYFALIGDLKQYDILDSLTFGITKHADSIYGSRGAVGFIFRKKVDGNARVAEAFTRLKVPA